jgi:hypothetical protein
MIPTVLQTGFGIEKCLTEEGTSRSSRKLSRSGRYLDYSPAAKLGRFTCRIRELNAERVVLSHR